MFITVGFTCMSQTQVKFGLNKTFDQIKKETVDYEVKVNDKGEKFIKKIDEGVIGFFYFNDKDVCHKQINLYGSHMFTPVLKQIRSDSRFVKITNTEYLFISTVKENQLIFSQLDEFNIQILKMEKTDLSILIYTYYVKKF